MANGITKFITITNFILTLVITGCVSNPAPQPHKTSLRPSQTINADFTQALSRILQPPTTPQKAPDHEPDGSYSGFLVDGGDYNTLIKNGYFDDYRVEYYPNFSVRFRAKLVNGLTQGWVNYHSSNNQLTQRVLYHQALIQEAMLYYLDGKLNYHFWYQAGKPIKGEKFDTQGNLIDSFLNN